VADGDLDAADGSAQGRPVHGDRLASEVGGGEDGGLCGASSVGTLDASREGPGPSSQPNCGRTVDAASGNVSGVWAHRIGPPSSMVDHFEWVSK